MTIVRIKTNNIYTKKYKLLNWKKVRMITNNNYTIKFNILID